MSQRADAAIEEARRVAEWLDCNDQRKRAEDVRRVCRQNAAYRETLRRLYADNQALRGRRDEIARSER